MPDRLAESHRDRVADLAELARSGAGEHPLARETLKASAFRERESPEGSIF